MDYDIFFCFFCGMCFSNFDRLIKVFLSTCGIHSNVGLSKNHIISFFEAISPIAFRNGEIKCFLDSMYLLYFILLHNLIGMKKILFHLNL